MKHTISPPLYIRPKGGNETKTKTNDEQKNVKKMSTGMSAFALVFPVKFQYSFHTVACYLVT